MQVVAGAANGICIGDLQLRIAPLEPLYAHRKRCSRLNANCPYLPPSAPIRPHLPLCVASGALHAVRDLLQQQLHTLRHNLEPALE